MNFEADQNREEEPSKSELKREMLALQDIGAKLVALDAGALSTIYISDEKLREEIAVARRIKSREGLRRQMQYIGKLMRNIDISPIKDRLDELANGRRDAARHFHALEAMRDAALSKPHAGIEAIVDAFAAADRQHLRQLVRQASREADQGKPPAAARKLFRYIRELHENQNPG